MEAFEGITVPLECTPKRNTAMRNKDQTLNAENAENVRVDRWVSHSVGVLFAVDVGR